MRKIFIIILIFSTFYLVASFQSHKVVSGNLTVSGSTDIAYGRLVGANESGDTLVVSTADIWHTYSYTNSTAGTNGSKNMTYDDTYDKLTINAGYDGMYMIVTTVSVSLDSADRTFHLAMTKNGSVGSFAAQESRVKFATTVFSVTMTNIAMLEEDDYIQVAMTSSNNGDVITVYHVNCAVFLITKD